MSDPESTHDAIRTIRLSDEQITALLQRLDEEERRSAAEAGSREYTYRHKELIVDMLQPGAMTPTRYAVQPRRLSESELWFLHGSFLHTGTQCTARLVTLHGTWANAKGVVAHCSYVQENIHDVSVQFTHRIDPALFCQEAGRTRVLLVEQDEALARLAEFHLLHLNSDVEHITECASAEELALKNRYDMILIDVEMNGGEGFETVANLRSKGYSQTIVAFSALNDAEDRERCTSTGCDFILAKPFTRDDVGNLFQSLRQAPLFSSFYDDPSMTELVNKFVVALPDKVRAIESAIVSGNLESLQTLIRVLRSQGSSYGFEALTDAAGKVESELDVDELSPSVRTQITQLVKLCMQARCAETGSSE